MAGFKLIGSITILGEPVVGRTVSCVLRVSLYRGAYTDSNGNLIPSVFVSSSRRFESAQQLNLVTACADYVTSLGIPVQSADSPIATTWRPLFDPLWKGTEPSGVRIVLL